MSVPSTMGNLIGTEATLACCTLSRTARSSSAHKRGTTPENQHRQKSDSSTAANEKAAGPSRRKLGIEFT
jgi:hypothetical protein